MVCILRDIMYQHPVNIMVVWYAVYVMVPIINYKQDLLWTLGYASAEALGIDQEASCLIQTATSWGRNEIMDVP